MARNAPGTFTTHHPAPRERLAVLLVDDCHEQRDLYELALGGVMDVWTASRGPEALNMALRYKPDAIVLDLEMPQLTGWDVCRMLKVDPRTSVPVIFLTASGDENLIDRARAVGAMTALTKPCPAERLLQTIAVATGGVT